MSTRPEDLIAPDLIGPAPAEAGTRVADRALGSRWRTLAELAKLEPKFTLDLASKPASALTHFPSPSFRSRPKLMRMIYSDTLMLLYSIILSPQEVCLWPLGSSGPAAGRDCPPPESSGLRAPASRT